MDRQSLELLDKEALIQIILAQAETIAAQAAMIATLTGQVQMLTARVGELEAKLGLPPKTPDNSSTPPSQGQKPSQGPTQKNKRKAHKGAHRALHPNPTSQRDVLAASCQHCGTDVSQVRQTPREAYDHVEIPPIEPDVTRVTLHGGVCRCCAKSFKADAPADMGRGSPFGPNLRALVIYLRFTQAIGFERLATLLSDLLGLAISEGALINILDAAKAPFSAQTSAIKANLLAGTILQSD
jgi:transposase